MTSAAAGLVLGLISAWSVKRLLYGLLYGVSSTDATTYVTVAAVIVLTAAFATLMPSLGATRIDPLAALREQ
jgi:ABC-type antimicrobial peptide transport system permease subunit